MLTSKNIWTTKFGQGMDGGRSLKFPPKGFLQVRIINDGKDFFSVTEGEGLGNLQICYLLVVIFLTDPTVCHHFDNLTLFIKFLYCFPFGTLSYHIFPLYAYVWV